MTPPRERDPLPLPLAAGRLLAAAYALLGLAWMLLASPRVPYADPYRFLVTFLTLPFPQNALEADNGHREIFPNLLRIAEIHWLDANQWLQILTGIALTVAAVLVMLLAFRRCPPPQRAAAQSIVLIGVFWLGNTRKLSHGNESVHLGLVLLALAGGLRSLTGLARDHAPARSWAAAGAGLLAVLSFGSGPACFAAFFAVLALQRVRWHLWLPVVGSALLSAALLLYGGDGERAAIEIHPMVQVEQLLRWIGAPFVWILSPLLDSAHAARLPTEFLRTAFGLIADPVERTFGPSLSATWPAAAFGGLGLFALATISLRAWRRNDIRAPRLFALGLCWFGVTVGLLVVLLRAEFFERLPDQVTSQRYVPWSMMFWIGLGLAFALRERGGTRLRNWLPLAIGLLLLPSQVWTGRYAFKLKETADVTALGAAVGVLDREFPLVETVESELLEAVPMLRERHLAMFAWEETGWLGGRIPDNRLHDVPITDVEVEPVANRFEGEGCEVRFHADAPSADRLLLLDRAGTAHGLASELGHGDWFGWLRGRIEPNALRAAALR